MREEAVPGKKRASLIDRTFTSIKLYPSYRYFWLGSWTEHMGEWMETTALLWLLYQLRASPLLGTMMVTFRHLPMVVFSFVGGVAADRFNRRTILIFALLASSLFSIGLALLVHFGVVEPWHILLYGALGGVANSFNHPARHALVPNLVRKEHYLNAITLDNSSVMVSRVVGTPLAGLIIGFAGTTPVLGLRALGAIMSLIWVFRIHVPATPPEARTKSLFRNFTEGMAYVGKNRNVLSQVLLYLLPFFVSNSYTGLLPYYASEILHVGPELYGFMNAAPGAGSLLVTFTLASLVSLRRKGLVLLIAGIVQGSVLILFAWSGFYILSLVLLFFLGAANTTFMTLNNTVIQEMISDKVRGRVMSLREVSMGIGPSGSMASGAVAESFGGSIALTLTGGVAILILLGIITLLPQARRRT